MGDPDGGRAHACSLPLARRHMHAHCPWRMHACACLTAWRMHACMCLRLTAWQAELRRREEKLESRHLLSYLLTYLLTYLLRRSCGEGRRSSRALFVQWSCGRGRGRGGRQRRCMCACACAWCAMEVRERERQRGGTGLESNRCIGMGICIGMACTCSPCVRTLTCQAGRSTCVGQSIRH